MFERNISIKEDQMKRFMFVLLAVLFLASNAHAVNVALTWTAPTENSDQDCSPNGVPLDDLAGFRVGWGVASGTPTSYQDVPNPLATSATVDVGVVEDVTLYFSSQAYDTSGNYSCPSNEVAVPFGPMAPAPPTLTDVVVQ